MTTPLHKLVEKWRMPDPENSNHYWDARGDQCAIELEAALAAHNQRWLDLADELEGTIPSRGDHYLSGRVDERRAIAKRIRQMVKEQT